MSIVSKVIDDSCIQYKIQRVKKAVQNSAPEALKKGFVTYAEVASRQMPPPKEGKKSRSIPAKLYKRNILPISRAIKTDKKNKKQLTAKIRQGYRFVVYGYIKRGKRPFRWYATTLRGAKKFQRIKYRGLYKWLWGAGLQTLGEKSTMFDNLLKKSPDMAKKRNLAAILMKSTIDETKIEANYIAEGIDYFANKGKKDAKSAMLRKMKKLLVSKVTEELKNI